MLSNKESGKLNYIVRGSPGNKVLFVGIGNVLKSDDGVGVYICREIKESPWVKTLIAEVSIENYIGWINRMNPDTLILVDCAHMNAKPGSYKMLKPAGILDQTFNTHNISLRRLSDFFTMETWILGIQPESIQFGENLSHEVRETAGELILLINRLIDPDYKKMLP